MLARQISISEITGLQQYFVAPIVPYVGGSF